MKTAMKTAFIKGGRKPIEGRRAPPISADVLPVIPTIKEFGSRKDWERGVWRLFIAHCAKLSSPRTLSHLLNALVATTEQKDIVYRLAGAARLAAGKSYRAIGEEFWLSPQTISAIRKGLTEKRYQSSHMRGHVKKKYSVDPPKWHVREGAVRRTKYGRVFI